MTVNTLFASTDTNKGTMRKCSDVAVGCVEALLEMTANARRCLACDQKLVVDRAVHVMAHRTAVSHCIVNEYPGPLLILVAIEALFVRTQQQFFSCCANVLSMHAVAIGTVHYPLFDGMMVLEHELPLDIEVAGEA